MLIRKTCLAVVAICTVACTSNPPASGSATSASADTASVRAAIDAANARFGEALKKGDKAGLMANYADDAIIMNPNEEAWRGRDALDKGFTAQLSSQVAVKDAAATTLDLMVNGDLAVETGMLLLTLQPKDRPETKAKLNYLTVWKRQTDGTWKIVRDINNSALPRQ